MAEPSCLEELPSSLREELVSLGAWIRDGLLQGETNISQSEAWIRDGLVYSGPYQRLKSDLICLAFVSSFYVTLCYCLHLSSVVSLTVTLTLSQSSLRAV